MEEGRKLGLGDIEIELCSSLQLPHPTYLLLKDALLQEARKSGFVGKDAEGKILAKIDVGVEEGKGRKVVEFVMRTGWVRVKGKGKI